MKSMYFICGISVICCFWRFTSASMTQTVKFDKSDFTLYAEDKYDRISSEKHGTFGKEGEPELPGMSITLIIPTGQTVTSIKIDSQDKVKIEGVFNIYPTQSPVPTSIYAEKPKWVDQDPGVYLSDEAYPEDIFYIVSEGYFDGATRLLTLKISPFQYLPLTGELWFTNQVTFTLNYAATKEPSLHPLKRSENIQKIYDGMLERIVYNTNDIKTNQIRHVNNKNLSKGNAVQAGSCDSWEYTVITNEALAPYFSDFVTFKKRRGIDIGLVTVEDIYDNYIGDQTSGIYDEAGKIRKYLTEAYSDHTVWVLLGGDDTVIPVRYGAASSNTYNWNYIIPTDLYYAELNGDWDVDHDYYIDPDPLDDYVLPPILDGKPRYGEPYPYDSPQYQSELYVGRLAVSTQAEIENWFDKYLLYCTNPNNGDYTYLTKALVTQEDQLQHCNAEAQTLEQLFSSFYTTEIIEENAGSCSCNPHNSNPSFPLPSDVVSEINENYGLICFQNHGGPRSVSISTGEGYDDENPSYYHCHTWRPWYSLHDYRSTNGNQSGINFLTNINAYSVIYTEACDVAAFDFFRNPSPEMLDILPEMTKTFMEAFIESEKKGSIIFTGNTRYGWIGPSFDLQELFFNSLLSGTHNKFGIAEATSIAGYTGTYDHYLKYSHNLFGDPEMDVWLGTPSLLYSASVTVGSSSVTVDAGVSGSTICVSSGNNGSSYYSSQENVQSYTFSTSIRPLYITITKPNYIPYTAVTGGTFTTAETWFGNLHVLGGITFNGNGSLKLLPGTNVLMDGNFGIGFYDNAYLHAKGTAESPIVFTSTTGTTPKSWNRLYFRTSDNILRYCEVKYSDWGLHFYGSLSGENLIDHCNIHDNDQGIRNELGTLTIKGCEIHNNRHNIVSINNPQVEIEGNHIYNGGRDGIYSYYNSFIDLYGNVIENNGIGGTSSRNGIYTGYNDVINIGNRFGWEGYNTIRSNYSNEIYAYSNAQLQVFFNSVHDNTDYEVYNSSSQNIQAPFNWWGEAPPNPTQFYGSVNYFDELEFEPDWEGETFLGHLSKPIVKNPGQLNSPTERIALLRTIIATETKSARADSALRELFAIVRSDYVENKLQEREHFYQYLSGLYNTNKDHPIGQTALQYMLLWQILSGEYQTAIALAMKASAELPASYQSNILLSLFYLYTYTNQFNQAKEILTRIEKHLPSSDLDMEFLKNSLADKQMQYEFEKALKKETIPPQAEPQKSFEQLSFLGIYPNPFNPITRIEFILPESNWIEMSVYDLLGRTIWQSGKVHFSAGSHSIIWDGTNQSGQPVSTGIYIVRLITPEQNTFQKVLLMK